MILCAAYAVRLNTMNGDDEIRMKASEILEKIREAMPPRKMIYGEPFTKRQFDKIWKAIDFCEATLSGPS